MILPPFYNVPIVTSKKSEIIIPLLKSIAQDLNLDEENDITDKSIVHQAMTELAKY